MVLFWSVDLESETGWREDHNTVRRRCACVRAVLRWRPTVMAAHLEESSDKDAPGSLSDREAK